MVGARAYASISMDPMKPAKRPYPSPVLYVALGLLGGALYAGTNTLFDVWDRQSPLVATWGVVHGFVDRGIPLLVGGLLGLAVHYGRLRHELARAEAERAEDLVHRLQRVERNQAVWVVATSTLHEVRNPLHGLGLLLDEVVELEGRDGADVAPERARLLERARAQMVRVDTSIAALRKLASSAKPQPREVNLSALVEAVARDAEVAKAPSVELSVEADRALVVEGDEAFLRIIVENLVTNALDALREEKRGRVLVRATTVDGAPCVRVSDDGPGIADDVRASMFEPLATTKVEGMGLGLAISRALARTMRGDVACTDVPGWSTTLELRLPA